MAKKKKSRKSADNDTWYEDDIPTGLSALLPQSASGQLLLGVLIGGGIAYVMSDEELRKKIIRQGVTAFGNMAGAMAELQEQIADVQAEVQAEQASDA